MNAKLNVSRYADLSKAAAICLPLLFTACGKDDPQKFLQEGKVLFEKGELEAARVQYKNALQINPKLSEAYYQIALLEEKRRDWKAMMGALLETVALDFRHLDAHVKLGQIYILSGQLDKAAEEARQALELDQESPTAILFDASLRLRQGNITEALQRVERVLSKAPFNVDAIGLKASILVADKHPGDAKAVLIEGIEQNPDAVALRLLKIRLEVGAKNFDVAIHDYDTLIEKYPDDPGFRTSQVALLSDLGRFEQAESNLRKLIQKYPTDVDFKLKLVDLIQRRNIDQTETILKEFISEAPQELKLKLRLVDYYLTRQRYSDAKVPLNEIVATDPKAKDGLSAKVKLAEIALLQQDVARAESLAEEVLGVDVNNSDALMLRTELRLNKKDADGAISDLRIVLRDKPNFEKAMILMGQAHLLKGEKEVAESEWRKVLEINPGNMNAIVALSNQLVKRGDAEKAEEIISKAAKVNPSSPALLEMLIQLQATKRDWAGAHATLDRLKKIAQADLATIYWEGLLASQEGRTGEALAQYRDFLSQRPDNSQVLSSLVGLYEKSGRRTDLISFLHGFIEKNPRVIGGYDALVMAYLAENKPEDADKVIQRAIENLPDDVELKLKRVSLLESRSASLAEATLKDYIEENPKDARLKARLVSFFIANKRYSDASAILKATIDADPAGKDALSAKLKLAEVAMFQGDAVSATALADEVLKTEPNHIDALMMRATLRLSQGDSVGTLNDLQVVLNEKPNFERALLLTAQAHYSNGDGEKAERDWRGILGVNPANLDALVPLTQLIIRRGDWIEVAALLDKAIQGAPGNTQVLEYIIQVKATHKDWTGAQTVIAELRKQPQGELPAIMWEATLAMGQNQFESAIKLCKETLGKNPNLPSVMSALARAYEAAGRQAERIAYFNSFLQKHPDIGAAHEALAIAYASSKKWSEAERVLQARLKNDPKSIGVYSLLGKIYAEQNKGDQVISIYRKGLDASPANPQLLLELAKFYNQKRESLRAMETYEEILRSHPDNVEAANNLADLLVNTKNDSEALSRARRLVEPLKNSTNPVFLDTYAWVLFKSGDPVVALSVLKKVANALPTNAVVRYHLGEVLYKNGDIPAAKTELEKALSLAKGLGFLPEIERVNEILSQIKSPS
ncbi:tetratricopeptide repeat protein [Methylococcus sp. EFPC2]|uniref:tetratricopeptide repeat protein n=1 Tax=Methylococcus sp. EFPC2 TaxID=2812648 RepID=UPI0019679A1D|nr:tetratricopeptide repeat protein [Methylococcus sp. EFPC2]QSA97298.1 tetratricopeptide repeat protein [Methylococcus sp. EFPC2]